MTATITSFAFAGIEAVPVQVQAHIASGIASMSIVGMANKAVSEARERIRAAFSSMGLSMPAKRITVNLAPADLPKEGSHFDLPIALALLLEMEVLPADLGGDYAALGELGLDGSITPVTGALPAAIAAASSSLGLICPKENGAEASWAAGCEILAVDEIPALLQHFTGKTPLEPPSAPLPTAPVAGPDLGHVKGQKSAKRALEAAAAGGHHLLMNGQPGVGKSMLASRLPGLLPPLSAAEMLEVSMIQSVAGKLEAGRLSTERPFRAPHHSASMAAMIGGGHHARPGEVSLAHLGVLFTDEMPEFSPSVLDSLRQPLESGAVSIARANHHVHYPARFQLIAAMNPCRCGYGQSSGRACGFGRNCEARYRARISGPLLDRFDMHVTLSPVPISDLAELPREEESSATVRKRVIAARQRQQDRFTRYFPDRKNATTPLNAYLPDDSLNDLVQMDTECRQLLNKAAELYRFSARAYHRCMKLALTFADLENTAPIRKKHVAEAISFRLF